MANGAREIRITAPLAIGLLGAVASTAAGLFAWHSAQRERLEDRLLVVISDTEYVINQRDDRQDIRRRELYNILNERMNKVERRAERMEDMVLQEALKSLIKERVMQELPPVVREGLPEEIEDALRNAP